MYKKSRRVIRFALIQFLALIGWICVQSFFSLSPVGRLLPFVVTVFIEAIWWSGLLFIMFLLFFVEYNRFVQAAIDLEEANQRLRRETNRLFQYIRNEHLQEESEKQDSEGVHVEAEIRSVHGQTNQEEHMPGES